MTPDQLDEDAIFNAVRRTLEKHKDISGYAAADLAILNLNTLPAVQG